jgi:hypothetical protein
VTNRFVPIDLVCWIHGLLQIFYAPGQFRLLQEPWDMCQVLHSCQPAHGKVSIADNLVVMCCDSLECQKFDLFGMFYRDVNEEEDERKALDEV